MAKRKALDYSWKGSTLAVQEVRDDGKPAAGRLYDFAEIPEALNEKFLQIGRRTKLGNFAVEAEGAEEKFKLMDAGFDLLKSGEWEFAREGGGPTVSVEIEAIANLKGISVAQAQKAVRALKEATPEKYEALIKSPKVAAEVEKVRKAREGATEVDLTTLM